MTLVGADPDICGAELLAETVIVNAARLAENAPSETLMTIFGEVPTSPDCGVPLTRPVEVLKFAHDGRPETENVNVSFSGSLAVGVNE